MMSSTASSPLNSARRHARDEAVVPEAAVAHDRERRRLLDHRARRRRALARLMPVAEDRVADGEGLEGRERRGSRCRPTMCTRPMSCCDELHRREHRALRAADAEAAAAAPAAAAGSASAAARRAASSRSEPGAGRRRVDSSGRAASQERRRAPRAITSTVYSPAIGSRSLPCKRRADVGRAQEQRCDLLLDVLRLAFLDAPARRACRRRIGDLLGHQRMHVTLSTSSGMRAAPKASARPRLLQRARQRVVAARPAR